MNISFDINEIKVENLSNGEFQLKVFLKNETVFTHQFEDERLFLKGKNANSLTDLKNIFTTEIQQMVSTNPNYLYYYSNCELFFISLSHILEDDDHTNIYNDSMELVKSCAIEKNIEFDGYFNERWEISAATVVNFDEEYFENEDRRDLYVFLSAIVDDEIFDFLKHVFQTIKNENITKDLLQEKINYLIHEKGVRF